MGYLENGWYERSNKNKLRREVVDAAIDVAGTLWRNNVPPDLVFGAAFKARSLMTLIDPHMQGASLSNKDREKIRTHLQAHVRGSPELASFLEGCTEFLKKSSDLSAFYLHVLHVGRMLQLLSRAVGPTMMMFKGAMTPEPNKAAPAKKTRPKKRKSSRPKKSTR